MPTQAQDLGSTYESVEPLISLEEDLVLPELTMHQIHTAITAIRHHKTIYRDWGFEKVDPLGRNVVLNFFGPPGTGKTMAAEALAKHLGLRFLSIGISEIESKFVGDTAKNIVAAFESAIQQGALLFFDEADTLLGARLSSVTQGVDNEINAMRSTMLIELQRYEGVVVFASNFAKNYDPAFVGRIRMHIEFALPDESCRYRMFDRLITSLIPLKDDREVLIDFAVAHSHGFSGRDLLNVMRNALPLSISDMQNADTGNPGLALRHLEKAIEAVRVAQRNVGKVTNERGANSVETARRMLGVAEN